MLTTNTLTIPARFVAPTLDDDELNRFGDYMESIFNEVEVHYDIVGDEGLLVISQAGVEHDDDEPGEGEVHDFLVRNRIPFDSESEPVEDGARAYAQWRVAFSPLDPDGGVRALIFQKVRAVSAQDTVKAFDYLMAARQSSGTYEAMGQAFERFLSDHPWLDVGDHVESLQSVNERAARDALTPNEREAADEIRRFLASQASGMSPA